MAIYRRGKTWWYSFTFNGRQIQRSAKVKNKREAEKIEKAAWTQLARGEVGIADRPKAERKTIGQLFDAVEKDFRARKKDTPKNMNLIATVRGELGDRYADSLTTSGVTEYVSSLRKPAKSKKKGRRSKSLSDSTIKHRLQILASAYELGNAGREEAKVDPLAVPRFPKLTGDNARDGFLNRAPFDVLSHLPADLKDFALFAYLTGWRKGAIARLEFSDFHDGNIYLRGVFSKNKKPYYVPVLGELVQLIERRKEARSVETPQGIVLANLVFHHGGETISEFRKAWRTATLKAGCPTLS
jgi:integrase